MLNDHAKEAMKLARYEADRSGYPYVSTSHILVGISKLGYTTAVLLEKQGINTQDLRDMITVRIKPSREYVEIKEWPLTSNAKKVMQLALEIAHENDKLIVSTNDVLQSIWENKGS